VEAREKAREVRLRALLDRRGYRLVKSHRRDPYALDYGYSVLLKASGKVVSGPRMTLDDVEGFAKGTEQR
jgi:hypothetical protein